MKSESKAHATPFSFVECAAAVELRIFRKAIKHVNVSTVIQIQDYVQAPNVVTDTGFHIAGVTRNVW
jgi:hypothetical protein